jgi:hypothetical protein
VTAAELLGLVDTDETPEGVDEVEEVAAPVPINAVGLPWSARASSLMARV